VVINHALDVFENLSVPSVGLGGHATNISALLEHARGLRMDNKGYSKKRLDPF